jgi:hypothetical protein
VARLLHEADSQLVKLPQAHMLLEVLRMDVVLALRAEGHVTPRVARPQAEGPRVLVALPNVVHSLKNQQANFPHRVVGHLLHRRHVGQ